MRGLETNRAATLLLSRFWGGPEMDLTPVGTLEVCRLCSSTLISQLRGVPLKKEGLFGVNSWVGEFPPTVVNY